MQAPNPKDVVVGLFPSSPTDRAIAGPDRPQRPRRQLERLLDREVAVSKKFRLALVFARARLRRILELVHQRTEQRAARLRLRSRRLRSARARLRCGLIYSNQLSSQHLLTAEASYMTQKLQTYNAAFSSTDPSTISLAPTGLGHDSLQLRHAQRQVLQLQDGPAVELFRRGQPGRLPHVVRLLSGRRHLQSSTSRRDSRRPVAGGEGRRALDDDRERAERASR